MNNIQIAVVGASASETLIPSTKGRAIRCVLGAMKEISQEEEAISGAMLMPAWANILGCSRPSRAQSGDLYKGRLVLFPKEVKGRADDQVGFAHLRQTAARS